MYARLLIVKWFYNEVYIGQDPHYVQTILILFKKTTAVVKRVVTKMADNTWSSLIEMTTIIHIPWSKM